MTARGRVLLACLVLTTQLECSCAEDWPEELSLGVCWYPEQWNSSLLATDALGMADLGLRYVRIAEVKSHPFISALAWG